MEMTLRTFSVLVDDEPGVLSQISRLFSRKGSTSSLWPSAPRRNAACPA